MNMEIPGPEPPVPIQSGRAGLMYMAISNNAYVLRYLRDTILYQLCRVSRSRPVLVMGRAYLTFIRRKSCLPYVWQTGG